MRHSSIDGAISRFRLAPRGVGVGVEEALPAEASMQATKERASEHTWGGAV